MVNNLKRLKVAAIAHNDEAKVLGTAHASYPAADLNFFVQIRLSGTVNFSYSGSIHLSKLLILQNKLSHADCPAVCRPCLTFIILYFSCRFKGRREIC